MSLVACRECGQQISDSASVCPHCGAHIAKEFYCQRCGTKVQGNVKFCPNCGTDLQHPAVYEEGKDKLVAGLLAILLGYFGIHYFYLGKVGAGVLTIVLSCCTCGIWSVLMLIQGILMLTMTQADFNAKYVDSDKTFPLF